MKPIYIVIPPTWSVFMTRVDPKSEQLMVCPFMSRLTGEMVRVEVYKEPLTPALSPVIALQVPSALVL